LVIKPVKEPDPGQKNPKLQQPGYGKEWYKEIIEETGDKFKYKGEGN